MITIIDYGMGNLRSVSKALEHLGGKVCVSDQFQDIEKAEKLILPGVGAFGDASKELKNRGLITPIRVAIENGKKFLGICLGMHLLFPESEESPTAEGLSVFPGKVKLFRSEGIKIPHMGWNQIQIRKKHPLLEGVEEGSYFYFVHSFYVEPKDKHLSAADCLYGEENFSAMIGTNTVFATQFHPEKSQAAGLQILKNFIQW